MDLHDGLKVSCVRPCLDDHGVLISRNGVVGKRNGKFYATVKAILDNDRAVTIIRAGRQAAQITGRGPFLDDFGAAATFQQNINGPQST